MGADLLISCVSIKGRPNKEYREIGIGKDMKKRTQKMLDNLNTVGLINSDEWIDLFDFINGEEVPDDKEVKEIGRQVIKEFGNCGDERDVTFLIFPERTIILAGGMSWGDTTEGYNIIQKFSLLPKWLLDAGGFE